MADRQKRPDDAPEDRSAPLERSRERQAPRSWSDHRKLCGTGTCDVTGAFGTHGTAPAREIGEPALPGGRH